MIMSPIINLLNYIPANHYSGNCKKFSLQEPQQILTKIFDKSIYKQSYINLVNNDEKALNLLQ